MIAVLQRVTEGSVGVEGEVVGSIGQGFVVLLGVAEGDTEEEAARLAEKTAHLRVFADGDNKFNLSALDVGGDMLVISQFTLLANCKKGRRPSFTGAAPPESASALVDLFAEELARLGIKRVEKGVFGAMMHVEIHNDGPVTIILDTNEL